MFQYIVKRIFMGIITLLVILLASYFLARKAPGDPTRSAFLGENAGASRGLSAEKGAFAQNKSLREKLHLDKPVMVGFSLWLGNVIFSGDLGESASVDKGRPVTKIIMERLPVTVSLNICAVIITYLLAIPIGIHSAVSSNSLLDKGITVSLFFLYSLPSFWVALLLQASLCEGGFFPLFPLKGILAENTLGVSTWGVLFDATKHFALPVFCLSYAGFAGLSRYARNGMLNVIKEDYIRTAQAKGLPEHVIILKHALKNALIILITLFASLLPGLIAGSIIIEYVFNIPGMGSLSMMALSSRDIPLLMALFGFGSALTLAGIILADFLYVVVDPRITFEEKR